MTNLTFEFDLRFDVVEWKVTVKSQTASKCVLVCVMFWCGGVVDLWPGEGWFSWRSGRVHGVWDTERNTADGTGRVHNYNRDTMGHCGALTGRDTRHKHTPARARTTPVRRHPRSSPAEPMYSLHSRCHHYNWPYATLFSYFRIIPVLILRKQPKRFTTTNY